MTSSDGNDGHPRKYASFPKKYREYVVEKELLTTQEFVHRSSGLTADTFGIAKRGYLRPGYFADVSIIDPDRYEPAADFQHWNKLTAGVDYLFVNGALTLDRGVLSDDLGGRVLKPGAHGGRVEMNLQVVE